MIVARESVAATTLSFFIPFHSISPPATHKGVLWSVYYHLSRIKTLSHLFSLSAPRKRRSPAPASLVPQLARSTQQQQQQHARGGAKDLAALTRNSFREI
jgi:hypothetical protein